MNISIVIPTLNEEINLGVCLTCIHEGLIQPVEVIVADALSADHTREIAVQHGARVVDNPLRHAAGGRNAGIAVAKGELIVFTDADCRPRPDWLLRIVQAFEQDPALQGVGGPMVSLPPRTAVEAFWARTFLVDIMPFPSESCLIAGRVFRGAFLTANCAYQRRLLNELGGFSDWFGNHAEDIDLFWRAIDSGARLRYLADAVVDHPFSHSHRGMMSKNFRNGVSSSKLQKRYGHLINFDSYPYRLFIRSLLGGFRNETDASLRRVQLVSHLAGKFYGSLIAGVINI